jgi:hypothetical protein
MPALEESGAGVTNVQRTRGGRRGPAPSAVCGSGEARRRASVSTAGHTCAGTQAGGAQRLPGCSQRALSGWVAAQTSLKDTQAARARPPRFIQGHARTQQMVSGGPDTREDAAAADGGPKQMGRANDNSSRGRRQKCAQACWLARCLSKRRGERPRWGQPRRAARPARCCSAGRAAAGVRAPLAASIRPCTPRRRGSAAGRENRRARRRATARGPHPWLKAKPSGREDALERLAVDI